MQAKLLNLSDFLNICWQPTADEQPKRGKPQTYRFGAPIEYVIFTLFYAASAFRFEPLYDSKNNLSWNALKMRVYQCQWGYPTVFG